MKYNISTKPESEAFRKLIFKSMNDSDIQMSKLAIEILQTSIKMRYLPYRPT